MLSEVLSVIVTFLFGAFLWSKYNNSYWKRHNVRFIKPLPFIGNLKDIFTLKKSLPMQMQSIYNTPGFENEPVIGIFALHKPGLLVRDLDIIKNIMIKDFNNFTNRIIKADPRHDPMGAHNLFFVSNPMWRELRSKITPVFTSGKIKQMYPLMLEICEEFEKHLDTYGDSKDDVDIKIVTARFTSDLIGSTAFGIRSNSLRDGKSEFFTFSGEVLSLNLERAITFAIAFFAPSLIRILRVQIFPKNITQFMRTSIAHVMRERAKSGTKRNDLIDILIALQKESEAESINQSVKSLPLDDLDFLLAQAAVFQAAGYETSATTTTFALYELAHDLEVQEKLRAEILQAFEEGDGAVSYERIQELKYLGMVVDETLRKYPIVGFLDRECTPGKDNPDGYSMRPHLDFTVPVGMSIYVSPLAIQRDPKYWPNPDKWDPERFAPANRDSLNMHAYMPFGIGPRNCIGMRIGLLQTKLGLLHFLRNHRVVKCSRTPNRVEFDPRSPLLTIKGGTYLRVERIN